MSGSNILRFWDLLFVFASREISVRYKQSVLGIWWVVLKPLATVTIFTVVFSQVLGLENNSPYPYWFFVIAGIIPWLYFSYTISECSNSILADAEILKKIPIPKLLSPITSAVPSAIELLIGIAVIFLLKIYLGGLDYRIFYLPFALLFVLIAPMGFGVLLASLSVFYRDFKFVVPFILQIGIYITPIGYSIEYIPKSLLYIFALNPMVFGIEFLRWCLGINTEFPSHIIIISGGVVLIVSVLIGLFVFFRMKDSFVDEL